jgi:hypothetical protein
MLYLKGHKATKKRGNLVRPTLFNSERLRPIGNSDTNLFDAEDFHDHALAALAVEFRVENALLGTLGLVMDKT